MVCYYHTHTRARASIHYYYNGPNFYVGQYNSSQKYYDRNVPYYICNILWTLMKVVIIFTRECKCILYAYKILDIILSVQQAVPLHYDKTSKHAWSCMLRTVTLSNAPLCENTMSLTIENNSVDVNPITICYTLIGTILFE